MHRFLVVGHVESGEAVVMLGDGRVCTARHARNVGAIAKALFGWLP